jgi:two-component system response regulator AtoC
LENIIEQAMILSDSEYITVKDLPENINNPNAEEKGIKVPPEEYSLKKITTLIEEEVIRKALKATRGNRTQATKLLGISPPALRSKIRKLKIEL